MPTFQRLALTGFVALAFTGGFFAADPPKTDRYVAPLKTLIEMLQEDDAGEQHTAAKRIRDFCPGDQALEALPDLVAAMGRDLVRPSDKSRNGYDVSRMIADAVQTAGPKRIKTLFELTADKDPLVRAGAFRLLFVESDYFQKSYGTAKEKSKLDLTDLLKAVRQGVKDKSPQVRKQALTALLALQSTDDKLKAESVQVLLGSLDDREEIPEQPREVPALYAAVALKQYGEAARPAFDPLVAAIHLKDARYLGSCCGALGNIAKTDTKLTEKALSIFRELLSNSKHDWDVRRCGIGGLAALGRAAMPAVGDLSLTLTEKDIPIQQRYFVYQVLRELGPTSAASVPAILVRLEKTADRAEQGWILATLTAIGPAAGDAVKPLEEWAKKVPESDKATHKAVVATLARIK